jgi:hypothetical protein
VIYLPHPNPLPEGEGAEQERFELPSPSGRGTEGEGIRATILAARRNLRQFQIPVLLGACSVARVPEQFADKNGQSKRRGMHLSVVILKIPCLIARKLS